MKPSQTAAIVTLTLLLAQAPTTLSASGYEVHQVSREAIEMTLSFAGTVTADKTLQLTAQMPGRVADIAGREGAAFDQGAVLVELDDTALLARLEAAIETAPDVASSHYGLGMAYAKLGDREKSNEQLAIFKELKAGEYISLEGKRITIEVTHSTRAMCPPESLEQAFIKDLNAAEVFFFSDGNLYIDLKYHQGTMKLGR